MILPKNGIALVMNSPNRLPRVMTVVQMDGVLKECFWEQAAVDLLLEHFSGGWTV